MRYPDEWVRPGREELLQLGFSELKKPEEVDAHLTEKEGTTLLVVNSICGCAAGKARPGIADALAKSPKPDHLVTVFAGYDLEATARARDYLKPFPPSSPSMALLREGKLVFMLERHQIENREALQNTADLQDALREYCGAGQQA